MGKNAAGPAMSLEQFRANAYFGGLDLLRGLSILLVIFHHVPEVAEHSPLWIVQSNGRYGVSLFFVISGFLIATLLLRELRTAGSIALGNFYARRTLRLLPLYFACLAAHAVLVYGLGMYNAENRALFTEKLPAYAFFFSNWLSTATAGPFFQSWSLAAEEQFYLSFAFLLVFLRRSWFVPLAVIAIAFKFLVFTTIGTVDAWSTAWRIGLSYQESILWGVLLAFALENPVVFAALGKFTRSRLLLPLAAAGTAIWLAFYPIEHAATWDAELLYVMMTGLVLAVVTRPARPAAWLAPVAFVGRISYGLYLIHMIVISLVKKLPGGGDPLICFVVSTLLVVPAAALIYRFFEKPIIEFYKRRFSAGTHGAVDVRSAPKPALSAVPAAARP
jgi:peptidoglycan/LPS O-acetylase OafA/YrhL